MGVKGCVSAKSEEDRKAGETSKKIDKKIKEDAASARRKVKLLLLGAADSGKSTIAKQLRILHQDGFPVEDRKQYANLVHANALGAMRAMVDAMKTLKISYGSDERVKDGEKIVAVHSKIPRSTIFFTQDVAEALKRLWSDPGIQSCYERSREYQLDDSAKYFLDALDRLGMENYIPTEHDVLRTRLASTGILETTFQYKNLDFTLIDVAGHRSERRKWIHCFQDVTAIVFCVALSEFDQVLVEDSETNRMVESLKLFDSICNNPFFVNTAIILFLNKKDIFESKIQKSQIVDYFPDFKGRNTYEEGSTFIRRLFEDVNSKKQREIYTHFTCATDTNNVRFVFDAVSDVISSQILESIFGPN